jgi:single-stranded DNA-specific DHH superfamily exonuclease
MKRQLKSTKLVKKYHLEEKVKEIYSNLCLEKYGKCPPTMDLKLEFEAKKQALHGALIEIQNKLLELNKAKSNHICKDYDYDGISTENLNSELIEEICQDCVHYEEHLERLSKEIIELERYDEIIKHDYEILISKS